ncbi:MAG: hypothetical protein K2Y22_13590 [Candidatus Obscuribacterales bacterium]|nr:hypothetical protein [Candidatus Obscuribacterales bacterium]
MQKPTAIYLGWTNSQTSKDVEDRLKESFELVFASSFSFNEKTDQEALAKLAPQFVFAFGPLIVREPLLTSPSIAAINFHTAPPKWPGRGSCSMALLEGDNEFGVTAHIMDKGVDTGPILRVLRFPIEKDDDAETLRERTLSFIPNLVSVVIDDLKQNNWQPTVSGEMWQRKAIRQKDVIDMMRIADSDSNEMVQKKVKAFAHSQKPGPYIERAGIRFWYMKGLKF